MNILCYDINVGLFITKSFYPKLTLLEKHLFSMTCKTFQGMHHKPPYQMQHCIKHYTKLATASYTSTLLTEMIRSSETLVTTYKTARYHKPEDNRNHTVLIVVCNLLTVTEQTKMKAFQYFI